MTKQTLYSPLLVKLVKKGITCVLVKMPFNLAVFNVNAADKILNYLPEISNWYIGGHSLGGAMESSYVSKNENMKGLILLAAYPVSDTSKPVLVVYGSNDGVLDITKLKNIKNMWL
jgi:predicted esterase